MWRILKSTELGTAIHDETDGLTLCEWLSWGYNCTHCHAIFILLLWRFLCNSLDMWQPASATYIVADGNLNLQETSATSKLLSIFYMHFVFQFCFLVRSFFLFSSFSGNSILMLDLKSLYILSGHFTSSQFLQTYSCHLSCKFMAVLQIDCTSMNTSLQVL
jgi:hypothetical protein